MVYSLCIILQKAEGFVTFVFTNKKPADRIITIIPPAGQYHYFQLITETSVRNRNPDDEEDPHVSGTYGKQP